MKTSLVLRDRVILPFPFVSNDLGVEPSVSTRCKTSIAGCLFLYRAIYLLRLLDLRQSVRWRQNSWPEGEDASALYVEVDDGQVADHLENMAS